MKAVLRKLMLILICIILLSCSKNKEKIKVAAILSLTGSGYVTGENAKNALELLEENVNKNGGIDGKKLDILFYDSETSLDKANEVFEKVEESEKPLFYISTLSFVSVGLAKKAEKYKVPLIGVSVSSDDFTRQNKWCVRLSSSNESHIRPMISTIDKFKLKNIALLIVNDIYGESYLDLIKEKTTYLNVKYKHFPFTRSDLKLNEFNSEMNKYDGVVIIGFTPQVKKIVSYIKEQNYKGKIMGTANMTNPEIINELGSLEAFISAPAIYNENYIFAKELKKIYENRFGENLNHYAAAPYDVVNLVLEKLDGIEINRSLLIDKLREEYIYTGLLGIITSKEDSGEISFKMEPAVIRDGEIEF